MRKRTDFKFESLKEYCDKLYDSGSVEVRVQVALEMLDAAQPRRIKKPFYECVRLCMRARARARARVCVCVLSLIHI